MIATALAAIGRKFKQRAAGRGLIVSSIILLIFFQPIASLVSPASDQACYGNIYLLSCLAFLSISGFTYICGKSIFLNSSRTVYFLAIAINSSFPYSFYLLINYLGYRTEAGVLAFSSLFFMLNQILFLSDARKKKCDIRIFEFATYALLPPRAFIGPLIRYSKFVRELRSSDAPPPRWFELGFILFAIGAAKKLLIADQLDSYIRSVFRAAVGGISVGGIDAWLGVIGNAFQLYFELSGYCDMAMGTCLLLGLRLPRAFASPYRAAGLSQFWHRWHRTVTAFWRLYVYRPLAGKGGKIRRAAALLATTALTGAWLGPRGENIAWGLMQGMGLAIGSVAGSGSKGLQRVLNFPRSIAVFLFVALSWALLRSSSWTGVSQLFDGLRGHNGFLLPAAFQGAAGRFKDLFGFTSDTLIPNQAWGIATLMLLIAIAAFICFVMPAIQRASVTVQRIYFCTVIYFLCCAYFSNEAALPPMLGLSFATFRAAP